MDLLNKLLGRHQTVSPPGGLIGYFNLSDWWLTTLSQEQRDWIERTQYGLGDQNDPRLLTSGKVEHPSLTATNLLTKIAIILHEGGFRQQSVATFALAEAEAIRQRNFTGLHFVYHNLVELNYRERDKAPGSLAIAIEACLKQIAIAPRAAEAFLAEHLAEQLKSDTGTIKWDRTKYPARPFYLPFAVGYYQLAIIREKEGNFSEAIRLSKQALEQGWVGHWESRIARLEKKLQKQGKKKG